MQSKWAFSNINYSPDFERFWELCPKKSGKPYAYQIWQRLQKVEPESEQARLEGMKFYRDRHLDTQEQFLLNPSTFLNQRRWEDVPVKPQPKNTMPTSRQVLGNKADEWDRIYNEKYGKR